MAASHAQAAGQQPDDLHRLALEIKALPALDLAGVDPEERIVHDVTHFHHLIAGIFALDQRRLEIIEIAARERLGDMQLARLSVQAEPVPVEYSVGRVGILLNLKNYIAGPDGVNPPAGQKQGIACFDFHAVNAIGDCSVLNFSLEFLACDSAL